MVVCSSGLGSSKMLANRIRKEIPEITGVHTTSLLELPKLQLQTYDLILSTVPLPLHDEEYIIVNPLLTEEEIVKVRKAIHKDTAKNIEHSHLTVSRTINKENGTQASPQNVIEKFKGINQISALIIQLLETFQFGPLKDEKTIENLLFQAAQFLEKKKIVSHPSDLVFQLRKREAIGGLGIPNTRLAFYHCRTKNIINPSFSVFRLDEPIKSLGMDNKPILIYTILLLIAPEEIDDKALDLLSYLSTLIVESNESIYLFERGNAEQIISFLGKHFENYVLLQRWNLESL